MKRNIIIICISVFFLSIGIAHAETVELPKDARGVKIQSFAPDPAKSQVNSAMTGTITFKKGTGATVNITDWIAIVVDPTANSTYYFNTDTTKTYPLRAGQDNLVMVQQLATGESVVFVLGAATASVQGM